MGLKRFLVLQPRLLLAGLLVCIGFGAFATSAAAQDDGEVTTLTTYVRTCLDPGCTEDLSLTEPVDGVPVTVTDATTGDPVGSCTTGDSEPGACAVDVPAGIASVTITLDDAALPEGYVADDNPATLDLANAAEYPFLLMPVDGFPPEDDPGDEATPADEAPADEAPADDDVSGLPSTGMQIATPADDASDEDVSALPSTGMQVATPADDSVSELPVTGSGSSSNSAGVWLTALTALASVLGLVTLGARRMLRR
jgi:hypothetical protein